MELNPIELDLINIAVEHLCLDKEEISLDSDLFYLCIYDYMEFAEILMSIEETFNICLKNYDLEEINTIRQIANIIKEKNEA